jgi:hypothetical protein
MSRVNHNVNYLFDVDGETVWEKLRVIRGMLVDRELTIKMIDLNKEEFDKKEHDTSSLDYKKYLIYKDFNDGLEQDARNEVKFLREFVDYLEKEAEKTRIPGKTDDEMYEINFFEEMRVRLVRRAQAQVISYGRIQDDLLLRLMKNKSALNTCIEQGLLTSDIISVIDTPLLPSADVHTHMYLENKENEKND